MEDDNFLKFVLDPSFNINQEVQAKIKANMVVKKKMEQDEEDRVKNLKCPCCKSIEKSHFIDREHNGIYGSGSRAWIRQEYIVCLSCGVHYTDLEK